MIVALLTVAGLFVTVIGIVMFRSAGSHTPKLLDIPNERSSHKKPVIRGAGIALVLTSMTMYLGWNWSEANLPFVLTALSIASLGFLDDLFSLSAPLRLVVQITLVSIFVWFNGSYPGLEISGIFAPAITVIAITWILNAYNFMDGIDGIAGGQAIGASVGWILAGWLMGIPTQTALGAIVLGCSAGFLSFNWHPAKVFLGDVGSTFLGFVFAGFPLIFPDQAKNAGLTGLAAIFLWLFLFDSIYTRLGQIVRLKPFWRAHKEHLYQRIVHNGHSPAAVSGFFLAYSICVAITSLATKSSGYVPLAALLVLGPLVLIIWARKKV